MQTIITSEELVRLSEIERWRVIGGVAVTWVFILLMLELAIVVSLVPLWLLCCVLIGCAQNGLISWNHEASHYGLCRNKRLNDVLCDLFISGPVGLAVRQYRWQHLRHHRYLGDPEEEIDLMAWVCLRGGSLFSQIAGHLCGLYFLRIFKRYAKSQADTKSADMPTRTAVSLLGFVLGNAALFFMCALQGRWYVYPVLWAFPLIGIGLLISNFRTIVEHQPSSDVCDVGLVPVAAMTRCVRANVLEQLLIAPVGFYYHHHLFPGIPFHRLGEVRRILQERGYYNRSDIVWVDGYLRTVWKLAMTPGYGVRVVKPV